MGCHHLSWTFRRIQRPPPFGTLLLHWRNHFAERKIPGKAYTIIIIYHPKQKQQCSLKCSTVSPDDCSVCTPRAVGDVVTRRVGTKVRAIASCPGPLLKSLSNTTGKYWNSLWCWARKTWLRLCLKFMSSFSPIQIVKNTSNILADPEIEINYIIIWKMLFRIDGHFRNYFMALDKYCEVCSELVFISMVFWFLMQFTCIFSFSFQVKCHFLAKFRYYVLYGFRLYFIS